MGYVLPVTPRKHGSAEDRLRQALSELSSVRLAFFFGSRAHGHPREESDFDIAILVDESTAEMDRGQAIRQLAARLGREVSSALLDIVLLNDAPALLRHRVLRDGILLTPPALRGSNSYGRSAAGGLTSSRGFPKTGSETRVNLKKTDRRA